MKIDKHNFFLSMLLSGLCALTILLILIYADLVRQRVELVCLQKRYTAYLDQLQIEYGQQDQEDVVSLLPKESTAQSALSALASISIIPTNPSVPKKTNKFFKKDNASLGWPLKMNSFWLSSHYGVRKKKNGTQGFHHGIDLAALKGTPIYSAQEGVVCQVGYSPQGYGKYIKIKHQKNFETRYAHLSAIKVKKGQHVHKGMLIGNVGSTGAVWGNNASHLHFEVLASAKHINPLNVLQ